MLTDLDPGEEVPDALYLASLEHAGTPEEIAFRDVLIFHRDCLNGGLAQGLDNQLDEDGSIRPYAEAYREIGLPVAAGLIETAAAHMAAQNDLPEWEAEMERLGERYQRLTYGENEDQPDTIEAAAIRFAQSNASAFTTVVSAAESGDYKRFNISLGGED